MKKKKRIYFIVFDLVKIWFLLEIMRSRAMLAMIIMIIIMIIMIIAMIIMAQNLRIKILRIKVHLIESRK